MRIGLQLVTAGALVASTALWAADAVPSVATTDAPRNEEIVLDDAPFISARAAGMAGAMSPIADNLDAAYYNPAGIGGLHLGREKQRRLRQFYFPYLGVAFNKNAQKLSKEFRAKDASADRAIGAAVVDAHSGKRHYARASLATSAQIGRFVLVPVSDHQLATVANSNEQIDFRLRSMQGIGSGFSIASSKETLYLGVYSQYSARTEIEATADYETLISSRDRQSVLRAGRARYHGIATNVGMNWRFSDYGNPMLAIVARDVGTTVYEGARDKPKLKAPEDLTIGFSFSPISAKESSWNLVFEAQKLTRHKLAVNKKFRVATEFTLGGFGSNSILGARAGYNLAGVSGGLNASIGLLELSVASQAEDIGVGNKHVVERRTVAVVGFNLVN